MKSKFILSIILCGASVAVSPVLRAQDAAPAPATTGTDSATPGEHHKHGPGMMLQRLTTQLDLTADQQAQIKPILEAAHTQMQSIHQDTSLSQDEKMAKVKDAWTASNNQIEGILTAEQKTKFDAMKDKMRQHRQHGQGQAGDNASPSASPSPAQ